MNTYEELQDKACKDGIDVIDYPFNSNRIDGLYCDGTIAIRKDIETSAEKACVLAEELGHYYTSHGNIINMNDVKTENRNVRPENGDSTTGSAYSVSSGHLSMVAITDMKWQNS